MKKLLIFSSLFLLLAFQFNSDEKLNLDFAKQYLSKIEQQTEKVAKKYDLEVAEVLPIVFPECARFNPHQNAFESAVVQYTGKFSQQIQADFSVGYFQMKPSFIERIDKLLKKDSTLLAFKQHFAYQSSIQEEISEERLNRLFDEKWQIEYLCVFTKIMKNRYEKENPSLSFIEYAASAYNLGFFKTQAEIEQWSVVKAFPNGIKNPQNNVSYSELAASYKIQRYGNKY